jgi:hypothetical protein
VIAALDVLRQAGIDRVAFGVMPAPPLGDQAEVPR